MLGQERCPGTRNTPITPATRYPPRPSAMRHANIRNTPARPPSRTLDHHDIQAHIHTLTHISSAQPPPPPPPLLHIAAHRPHHCCCLRQTHARITFPSRRGFVILRLPPVTHHTDSPLFPGTLWPYNSACNHSPSPCLSHHISASRLRLSPSRPRLRAPTTSRRRRPRSKKCP